MTYCKEISVGGSVVNHFQCFSQNAKRLHTKNMG